MTYELRHLKYRVLPGNPDKLAAQDCSDWLLAFSFWRDKWGKLLSDLGTEESLRDDEFYTQDLVSTIVHRDNEVVGLQSLKIYGLDELLDSSYYKEYSTEFTEFLSSESPTQIMTMQHFIVNPRWSARVTKTNFASVVLGLNFKVFEELGSDLIITLARKDVPSHSKAIKYGMVQLGPDITMHNCPVSQLYARKTKPYPHQQTNDLINYFWNKQETKKDLEYEPLNRL